MKIQMVSVFSFALLAVACSKKDSDAAATTGAFLKPADFANLSLDQYSATQAIAALEDSEDIYQNEPASSSTPAGDGTSSGNPVMDTCMEKNQPRVSIIDKSTINVDANIDLLQCFKETAGSSSPSSEGGQFSMRFVFNITCPGADLSDLQGKTLDEVGLGGNDAFSAVIESKCKTGDTYKTFGNVYFVMKSDANTRQSNEIVAKFAQFAKDGSACTHTKTAAGYRSNECQSVSYLTVSSPGLSKKDLSIFETSNLLTDLGSNSTWFAGGAYKVTLNNFTGTLTYPGANAAPSYTLSGGGETLTGSLSSPTLHVESLSGLKNSNGFAVGHWKQLVSQAQKEWSSMR